MEGVNEIPYTSMKGGPELRPLKLKKKIYHFPSAGFCDKNTKK